MSWLRDRVESNNRTTVAMPPRNEPWVPPLLAAVDPAVLRELTYAVLDERDEPEGELSFVLSPWPWVDDLGRVRHRDRDPVEVAVPATQWQAMLAERRVPEVLRDRAPRIGDVFAVLLKRRDARNLLRPVGPVVDVTADARDAARAAFYGAVAVPLEPEAAAAQAAPEDDRLAPLATPPEWAAHLERKARR